MITPDEARKLSKNNNFEDKLLEDIEVSIISEAEDGEYHAAYCPVPEIPKPIVVSCIGKLKAMGYKVIFDKDGYIQISWRF